MSSAYTPMRDARVGSANIRKGEAEKYLALIKTALKKGGSAALSAALSNIGVPNPGAFASLYSAYSSRKHAERLTQLETNPAYDCSCGQCAEALEFAIGQKKGKAKSKVGDAAVGFVPHGGAVKAGAKALWDKYKGKPDWENSEGYWAVTLWGAAKPSNADISVDDDDGRFELMAFREDFGDCEKALAIIAELMGDYHEIKSWERAEALTMHRFGIDMIKAKLQAS